jgi:hypothetical protein
MTLFCDALTPSLLIACSLNIRLLINFVPVSRLLIVKNIKKDSYQNELYLFPNFYLLIDSWTSKIDTILMKI